MKTCVSCILLVVLCSSAVKALSKDWAYFYLKSACSLMGNSGGMQSQRSDSRVIAFQAKANKRLVNIPRHHAVKFGHIIINKGGGYDSSTGKFTAPVAGVYFFDWTIVTDNGDQFNTEIVKNGTVYVSNLCRSRVIKNYEKPCTATARIEMRRGEKVWIRVTDIGRDAHMTWSTFGGHKL
ncbi:complement C1q tumor necrosis factor-related protein 4-like [Saccostrea cucullata]|uniref:complement C1q tumor necrosis factor-related protein 4-like n=1 Tax=Saccostrea cuccullata TaxID=36930 RepID=UPI002ED428B4